MVAGTSAYAPRTAGVPDLRQRRRLPGARLLQDPPSPKGLLQAEHPRRRPLPGPVPFAPDLRRAKPSLLVQNAAAELVAGLVSVLVGDADPDLPGGLPPHLLLLPQGVLP